MLANHCLTVLGYPETGEVLVRLIIVGRYDPAVDQLSGQVQLLLASDLEDVGRRRLAARMIENDFELRVRTEWKGCQRLEVYLEIKGRDRDRDLEILLAIIRLGQT